MGSHHGPLVEACWYQSHRRWSRPPSRGLACPGGGGCRDIGGQRASRLSPHILCSALASFSWSADAAADWTPSLTGAVAGAADSEDNATTKEARRSTSCVSARPAFNNDKDDEDTQQLVLSRLNGVVRPDLPPPALSSPPLQCGSWSSQGQTAPSDLTRCCWHCPHPPSHTHCYGDGCRCRCRWQPKCLPRPPPQ